MEMKMMRNHVRSVSIQFKDLVYNVNAPNQEGKKTILNGISGTFQAGQLVAIMGPSGAGKSSLMNILTGFIKDGVSGNINFGDSKSKKMCCYIMQDDHFFPWLTVEEAMMFAATLKIANSSMNLKEKYFLIEHILSALKLSGIKLTKCSQLSSGQRKRLSIALELIDSPAVFFLDEPTTGLDSSSSLDTVQLLQILAREGHTVVCTIHQPSSYIYYMFDQIYVLSEGVCVYQGMPQNSVKFLKTIGLECPPFNNPADFLLECVNGEYGDYISELCEKAKNPQWRYSQDEMNPDNYNDVQLIKMDDVKNLELSKTSLSEPVVCNKHIYPPAEWIRLWMIIGRCHIQFYRDWTVTYLKTLIHILCAVLIGLLFGSSGSDASKQISNLASFLVHCVYLWYTTMMPGVLRFPQEIAIIKKETFNNWYKLRTYYIALLITSTPVHILFSSIYITIAYLMTDQPFEIDRYMKFMLMAVVVTICADGLGILLGTILNPINGTFIGAVLTCFMLIYSGFLILFTHMSQLMRVVSAFSPLKYAFEGMVLSVYSNDREKTFCPSNVLYCHFKNPSTILRAFGMEDGNYALNILVIMAQVTVFKSLAYFTLKRKIHH